MPNPVHRNALIVAVVGVAFCAFFEITKHAATLARVNPFGEDPYDAVGSFAFQFVLLVLLISLIRAFRPAVSEDRIRLQFAVPLMACVAIAFTLLADLIAMARHVSLWNGSPAGYDLAALTLCLLFWTAGAIAFLFVTNPRGAVVPLRPLADRVVAVPAAAALTLAVYPEQVRHTVHGAIVTALCGGMAAIVVVWSVGSVFAPELTAATPDLLDDVTSLAAVLGTGLHLRPADPGLRLPRFLRVVIGWLNPRTHRWNLAWLTGVVAGACLVGLELADGPSLHGGRRLLVIAVYLFLETASVWAGYALLARPLHLVRPANGSQV